MAKQPAPKPASVDQAEQLVIPLPELIQFREPVGPEDQVAVFSDSPPDSPSAPVLSDTELAELHRAAARDDQKRDFTLKVLEARTPKPELEPAAAVIAPRIIAQTNAELAAGRKLVDYNEALAVNRTPRPPDPSAGKNEAVFRPGDYVPDQKKGQGNNTQARTL